MKIALRIGVPVTLLIYERGKGQNCTWAGGKKLILSWHGHGPTVFWTIIIWQFLFLFFCKRTNLEKNFNSFFNTVYYERKDADFSNFSTIHFQQIGIWNDRTAKGIKKLNKLSSHVWYLKFNRKSYWARETMALIGPSIQYGPR